MSGPGKRRESSSKRRLSGIRLRPLMQKRPKKEAFPDWSKTGNAFIIIGKKGKKRKWKTTFSHAAYRRAGNRGLFAKALAAQTHSVFSLLPLFFCGRRTFRPRRRTHFYHIIRTLPGLQALFQNFVCKMLLTKQGAFRSIQTEEWGGKTTVERTGETRRVLFCLLHGRNAEKTRRKHPVYRLHPM